MGDTTFSITGKPLTDAARFRVAVKRAPLTWERGNNSGDPTFLAAAVDAAEKLQANAEAIAHAYGLTIQ